MQVEAQVEVLDQVQLLTQTMQYLVVEAQVAVVVVATQTKLQAMVVMVIFMAKVEQVEQ